MKLVRNNRAPDPSRDGTYRGMCKSQPDGMLTLRPGEAKLVNDDTADRLARDFGFEIMADAPAGALSDEVQEGTGAPVASDADAVEADANGAPAQADAAKPQKRGRGA